MNGKTAESRHAEHELMYEEYRAMGKWREEFTDTITRALATHSDVLHAYALDMQKQLATLERGIAEKTSMDAGLMVRQSKIEEAFSKLDDQNDRLVRAMDRVTLLSEQQAKQIDDAHKTIRVVGGRVERLEKKSGKLALKIVFGALGLCAITGGGLIVTKWVEGILARLP